MSKPADRDTIYARVSPDVKKKFQEACEALGRSESKQIEIVLVAWLKMFDAKKKAGELGL